MNELGPEKPVLGWEKHLTIYLIIFIRDKYIG